jgi:putative transposase
MRTRSRRVRQHELAFRSWGGARRGAGRKRAGSRPRVSHRARPRHSAGHPVHVTVRLREGLPTLRRKETRNAVVRAFAAGRDRFGFRLTQFSLQSNHLHLIAEACDGRALSLGMQGLLVRVARVLNALWNRSGAVFSDRFHARALQTPREVRAALVYVLHNARHHGLRLFGVDPFSSGPWFEGWKTRLAGILELPAKATAAAKTWLLCEGWLWHGRIGIDESPGPGRVRPLPREP